MFNFFQGQNYLIPVDSVVEPEYDCIKLNSILQQLNSSGNNLLSIIVLDAFRADQEIDIMGQKTFKENEPLKPAFGNPLTANISFPNESQFALICSSEPGKLAPPMTIGGNSLFTSVLLNHLETPHATIQEIMKNILQEVLKKTEKKQRPWFHSSLKERFYFNQGLLRRF